MIDFSRSCGLEYPIQKVPGSRWIVVGVTVSADGSDIHSLDIHFDGDDLNHVFEKPEDWPELPARMVEDFNAPHRKDFRLFRRRTGEYGRALYGPLDNAERAAAYMAMVRERRANPGCAVAVTHGFYTVGFVPHGAKNAA